MVLSQRLGSNIIVTRKECHSLLKERTVPFSSGDIKLNIVEFKSNGIVNKFKIERITAELEISATSIRRNHQFTTSSTKNGNNLQETSDK